MSIYYYHHTHTHNLRQRLVFGFGSILFWRTTANKIQLILGEYMKANESSLSNSNLTNKLNQSRKIRNAMTLISRLFVCVNVTCGLFFWYNNNLDVWIWLQGTIGSLHLFVYIFPMSLTQLAEKGRSEKIPRGEKWSNFRGKNQSVEWWFIFPTFVSMCVWGGFPRYRQGHFHGKTYF
jgi:hypothetical protein